jgi:hypothetical protein
MGLIIWSSLALVSLCLFLSKIVDGVTFIKFLAGLVLVMFPLYLYLLKKKEQTVLIAYTSRFLIRREENKIDELLGIIIAGKLQKIQIDPLNEFFETLKDLCRNSGVEMRRRIAEALPALYKMDLEHAEDVAELLRYDWDDRWKSDNRRRMIESLVNVIKRDPNFALKNLSIIDGDEIYTVIASIEVIHLWQEMDSYFQGKLAVINILNDMRNKGFEEDALSAINKFWNFLTALNSNKVEGARLFNELKTTPNIYLQICLARNVRKLCGDHFKCFRKEICSGSPDFVLDQMEFFLSADKNRNVRRPMAKETSLDCLTILLKYKTHAERSKTMIRKLINDADEIISITAFDKIENILDADPNFGKDIVTEVLHKATHPKLLERAQIISGRQDKKS